MSDYIQFSPRGFKQQLFLNAPDPTKEEIEHQMKIDMARNPHGDYYKPARRSKDQIIAQHKIAWVKEMAKAFEQEFF